MWQDILNKPHRHLAWKSPFRSGSWGRNWKRTWKKVVWIKWTGNLSRWYCASAEIRLHL